MTCDAVTLDYEGDNNYLCFDDLVDLCQWLTLHHPHKRFYYTISVRSSLYDIITYSDEHDNHNNQFLKALLSTYFVYDVFQVILVAGNKKYLSINVKGQTFENRMETFIKTLLAQNQEKFVFIGVDNIFKTGKRLLKAYSKTKAIFLLSPAIKEQLANFDNFENRICIYALQIDSTQVVENNSFIRGYLTRRCEVTADFVQQIHKYALIKNSVTNLIKKEKYFWFIFRA